MCILYLRYALFYLISFFFLLLLSTTERTHTAPWIYSIWYPLGCLISILCLLSCTMNILQGHKRKFLYFFLGGGDSGPDGEGVGGGGVDKNGWGRAWYYQTVLFISSFCKIRESRTQFYYFVPRLAAATVVTSRHQTAGNSTYHTQHPGTFSPPPTPTGRRYHLGSHVRVEVYEVSV